jgi:hypothetical protein
MSTTQVRIGSTSASALYWDNVNNRLGIGTSSPTQSIETPGAIKFASANSDSTVTLKAFDAATGNIDFTNEFIVSRQGTNLMKMFFNNRIAIGGAGSSAKLSIRGEGSTSATTSLLVQNSSGQQSMSVLDDGSCTIGINGSTTNSLTIVGNSGIQAIIGNNNFQSPANIFRYGGGTITFFGNNNDGTAFSFGFNNNQASTTTTSAMIGLGGNYQSQQSFQFANLRINPTYDFASNTTSNAIARGIYYNPTITNLRVAQHRAIETTTGDVLFGTTSGKATFGSGVAGTSYIEIKPGISNGFNRITFNDFDGGTATRGGFIEISTYLAQINFGSYNSFYLGNSSKPYNFYMVAGTSNIIISTGNIVPTDSGALFQVKGTGSTSATTSLLVQNSAGNTSLQIQDNGAVSVINEGNFSVNRYGNTLLSTGQSTSSLSTYNSSVTVTNTYVAFNTLGNYGWAFLQDLFQGYHPMIIQDATYKARETSALVELNSKTRGFLPPKMTTAQKLAIASPVGGLQVFDTTLNQMSYYNGSAWINF